MGFCASPTPEMGEYHVEVRRESFYISGETLHDHLHNGASQPRHVFWSEHGTTRTVEILTEDIPKIRAALDQVERIESGATS